MTTSYTTKTTITDTHLILESTIGSELITNVVTRGPNENLDLRNFIVLNKEKADVLLNTDSDQNIIARQQITRTGTKV